MYLQKQQTENGSPEERRFVMLFEHVENILTLLATILGLLGCLFRYAKSPKKGYLFLILFFLASFLSDYYWTVYTLVMGAYPEISEFLAYLGWNVAYVFLLLAVLQLRTQDAKRCFHPVIFLPVLTNGAQLVLYLQFGGIFNNLWQVGITTAIMVLCMQELVYFLKNRKKGAKTPHFAILVLFWLVFGYGMWTASCFDWKSAFLNPYLYLTLAAAVVKVLFRQGATKDYGAEPQEGTGADWVEFRFRTMFQAIASLVIIIACAAGYILAVRIKSSLPDTVAGDEASGRIIPMLLVISAVLILLILLLLYVIRRYYRPARNRQKETDAGRRNRLNLISIMTFTLVLMVFLIVYNSRILYRASVTGLYEDGKNAIDSTATDLENYLTLAQATLRVVADSADLMVQNGASSAETLRYLTDQTQRQSEQFDENFTGIYALINGEYMDGSGWVPPEGYDPVSRDWYQAAEADGEVVIVSPYVDAQTGAVVITVAKCISGGTDSLRNIVCLDVIVNYIQEVTEQISIAGKGYGMVVNTDGFIVAHRDRAYIGKNFSDIYGAEALNSILAAGDGRLRTELNGEDCELFTHSIMNQWIAVSVVNNAELYEGVYSQLAINIVISLVTFLLISLFYYVGYRMEQSNSRQVEEMQVVSALAEAIDAKDAYTNGHSSRVAKYAKMIAARVGYSEAEQNDIYMMGLLHDVGKIGIPDKVINKPGKLTAEEFEKVKEHPVIGSKILESIKERPQLATGARWHHERFDGAGYPDRLAGERIPEVARIIAVADAYDAMTSRRSYRDVMSQAQVKKEIDAGSGSQFDPRFARIMLQMIDDDPAFTLRENGSDANSAEA